MARKQRKQGNTGSLKGFIIFLLLIAGAVWFTQGSSYQLPDLRKELPNLHEEKPSAAQSAPLTGNQEKVSSQMEIPRNLTDRKERILKRTGYTLSYNSFYKTPNWVAWELTRKETEGKAERYDKFLPDPDLPEPRVEHSDYTRSGYDRGHMAPAADMKWSKKAMQESFYMSNICPQNQKLNRDDWGDLEDACRKWARKYGTVYIACGPIYDKSKPERIGKHQVAVPDRFFKVVLINNRKNPIAMGFVFPNAAHHQKLEKYMSSVDDVEKATGLDFFSRLPDSIENRIEAIVPALPSGR